MTAFTTLHLICVAYSWDETFGGPQCLDFLCLLVPLTTFLHLLLLSFPSFPHKDKGYDRMMSVVFTRYPQLMGDDVVKSMVRSPFFLSRN